MKYLLIRFSSLGDVVLTTPVARNIKQNDEDAVVEVLTKPKFAPVFNNNPYVDRVITALTIEKYDYLIDLHNSIRSNLFRLIIPAKNKIVYNKAPYARRVFLHTGKTSKDLKKSVVQRYLDTLEELEFNMDSFKPEIVVSDEEERKAEKMIPAKNYVCIAPGAKWKTKQWITEYYINLAKKIKLDFNKHIVLVGDKHDISLANKIKKGAGILKKYIHNMAGKTNIRELCAIIKGSSAVVSTDSGPMHIGWAAGVPVVGIFGPTVKEFGFQPASSDVIILEKELKCRPCSLHGSNKCKYEDRACMRRIEVHEVMDAIRKLL